MQDLYHQPYGFLYGFRVMEFFLRVPVKGFRVLGFLEGLQSTYIVESRVSTEGIP